MRARIRSVPPRAFAPLLLAITLLVSPRAGAQQPDSTKPATAAPTRAAEPAPAPDTARLTKDASYAPGSNKPWGSNPARFAFAAGGFLPHIGTTATIAGALLPATEINLEQKLGLAANTQTVDLYGQWRFKKSNVVTIEYFNFSRSASKTLTDSLIIGDSIYHAGATIDLSGQIQYYGVSYRKYFWRRQRWELGLGIGIDVVNLGLDFGIKASAVGKSDSLKTSGTITAPVPMFGLYAEWEAIPHLTLRGAFQSLYIGGFETYSGSVNDRRIAAEWYPWHNYGFGLGWHYVGLSIKKEAADNPARYAKFGYSIQGLSAYVTAAFGPAEPVAYKTPTFRTEPPEGKDFGLLPRTLSIALGGYLPGVGSSAQIKGATGSGTDFSLENTLGLPSSTSSVAFAVDLRTGNKSLVTFNYFSISRSGGATLADSIVVGDKVYAAGARLDVEGGLKYFGFSYRYYIWMKKAWQLGVGVGLDELELSTSTAVHVSVGGQADSAQHHTSFSAPAPLLGAYADVRLWEKFFVRASGEWISAAISPISGSLTDAQARVEWYALGNYGIGAGYHYIHADAKKVFGNGGDAQFKYTVQGPILYLTASF